MIRYFSVWRIRNFYLWSVHPGSRIPIFSILDPVSASKNLSIQAKKMVSKLSVICSSLIWILIFYPSRIPIQGSKKHRIPDQGPEPQHWYFLCGSVILFKIVSFLWNYCTFCWENYDFYQLVIHFGSVVARIRITFRIWPIVSDPQHRDPRWSRSRAFFEWKEMVLRGW